MYVGWIWAFEVEKTRPILEGLGVVLGELELEEEDEGTWDDCLVPDEAMEFLAKMVVRNIVVEPGQIELGLQYLPERLWPHGPRVWQEDDATRVGMPGHQTLADGWRQLFGEDLPEKRLCLHHDGGDAFFYLAPNGYTFAEGYDGGTIWEPVLQMQTNSIVHDMKEERDKALAACAQMRAALETADGLIGSTMPKWLDIIKAIKSGLASDIGAGWVSPLVHAEVVAKLKEWADWGDDVVGLVEPLDGEAVWGTEEVRTFIERAVKGTSEQYDERIAEVVRERDEARRTLTHNPCTVCGEPRAKDAESIMLNLATVTKRCHELSTQLERSKIQDKVVQAAAAVHVAFDKHIGTNDALRALGDALVELYNFDAQQART